MANTKKPRNSGLYKRLKVPPSLAHRLYLVERDEKEVPKGFPWVVMPFRFASSLCHNILMVNDESYADDAEKTICSHGCDGRRFPRSRRLPSSLHVRSTGGSTAAAVVWHHTAAVESIARQ